MIKEGKIGVQEAISLAVISLSNRIFFTAPAVVALAVGTSGWLMSLVSLGITIIAFTFIYLLLKRFPGKDLVEAYDSSFGKIIGFIVSFTYSFSFLAASGILIREFVEVLKVFVLPKSPPSIMTIALTIVIMVAAYLGLETIARVSRLMTYALLISLFILILMAAQNFDFTNIFPIMGYGLGKTIIEGISRSSAFSEIIVLALFAGSLQGIKHIKKAGYIALIISGLIVSITLLSLQLVFPYTSLQEQTAPLYVLARLIKFGSFAQKLDPVLLFLWLGSTIIACSIVFYSSVSVYCKSFRMQDKRPIIIPMGILLVTIAMFPKDISILVDSYIEVLRIIPIFLFYLLPLIALIVAVLRKKKGKKSNV